MHKCAKTKQDCHQKTVLIDARWSEWQCLLRCQECGDARVAMGCSVRRPSTRSVMDEVLHWEAEDESRLGSAVLVPRVKGEKNVSHGRQRGANQKQQKVNTSCSAMYSTASALPNAFGAGSTHSPQCPRWAEAYEPACQFNAVQAQTSGIVLHTSTPCPTPHPIPTAVLQLCLHGFSISPCCTICCDPNPLRRPQLNHSKRQQRRRNIKRKRRLRCRQGGTSRATRIQSSSRP